jgi:hypothetical protein
LNATFRRPDNGNFTNSANLGLAAAASNQFHKFYERTLMVAVV